MTVAFVPARVPLVDPRTGMVTREWYLLFQALFTAGGIDESLAMTVGPIINGDAVAAEIARLRDEALLAPVTVLPPAADDLAPAPQLFIPLDDVLPVVGALRDEIATLRAMVDDLQKGRAL